MATTMPVLDGTYELDRTHSTVQFSVRHVGVSTFRASFGDLDARLTIVGGKAALAAGTAVESISIVDPPEFREHVVHGHDFFAAHAHPQIRFESAQIDVVEDARVALHGVLEIRGVERPVTAMATFTPPTEDPFGNIKIGLALAATIDRRHWGMGWQTELPGGGDALGWEVDVSAQLEFAKEG
jgi:polyisoprenoid-binding protein YceI